MRIYVASSWRNKYQPDVVTLLRAHGHEVYDFRAEDHGFSWREVNPEYQAICDEIEVSLWGPAEFRGALAHAACERGFGFDMEALHWCDTCLLVLPCNRSAHLELGWACGAKKKKTAVYVPEPTEPELMYKMVDEIIVPGELESWSKAHAGKLENWLSP